MLWYRKNDIFKKIVEENHLDALFLSARKPADIEYIKLILESPNNGVIIIDD